MDYDFDKIDAEFKAEDRPGRPMVYPFAECPEGYSFFVSERTSSQVSPLICYWNKKLTPRKFTVRAHKANGERETKNGVIGVRVYRVK